MSFKKRMAKMSGGDLFHVVKIGWATEVAFRSAREASAFYVALMRAAGLVSSVTFDLPSGGTDNKTVVSRDDMKKVELSVQAHMTTDDVKSAMVETNVIRCDGVPKGDGSMCGCWCEADYDGELPIGWVDYVFDGTTRHMCAKCQEKDVKVAEVVVRTTGQC